MLKIYSGHMKIDAENLAADCVIARKLRQNPSLLKLAKEGLRRWAVNADPHSQRYFEGWTHYVMQRPLNQLIDYMTDLSEHGNARRQAEPFSATEYLSRAEIQHIRQRVKELFDQLLASPRPEENQGYSSRYIYQDQLDAIRQTIKEEFLAQELAQPMNRRLA